MAAYVDPKQCLPSSYELPDSDDTPVDNVDRRASRSVIQNWIPNLLLQILAIAWAERTDWFFGVDMGIYYDPDQPAVVPDGFLSLGVDAMWAKKVASAMSFRKRTTFPALEVVSKTYGGEYTRKKSLYAHLGIPYYAVYQPNRRARRQRQPLEVYELADGVYQPLTGERFWLSEVGLALERERGAYLG